MRFPLILLAIVCCGTTQAATVTIDFEEVTPQSSGGAPLLVESQGFTFEGYSVYGFGEFTVDASGFSVEVECGLFVPPGCAAGVSMENTAGSPFAILSIGSSYGDFSGTLYGGGSADLSAPIGTGDWLNLESFQIEDNCSGTGCYLYAHLDDITVNVVPIPAAAWLFGSALGLLGWMRRKVT